MRKAIFTLCSVALLSISTVASAQHFENITIAPGFTPDPAQATGLAGGERDGSQFGQTAQGPCVGQIDTTPDHVVTLEQDFSFLRFRVFSDSDTSLVIQGPRGYHCNDDTVGLDPVVEGRFAAGEYRVFVGAVGGGFPEYTLEVTEIESESMGPRPGAVAAGEPYQPITLEANFLPDPAIGTGRSGGPRDASEYGTTSHGPCVGQISTSADHVVTLRADFSFLRFRAFSDGDTSLVIIGPRGEQYCNDDAVGLDPAIEGAFSAGVYQVFIGSVGGQDSDYRLEITEMR